MENLIYLLALNFLLLALIIGLVRSFRGPTLADRMLSVLLCGTVGIAVLCLMSLLLDQTALLDMALIMGILAAVSVAALTAKETRKEAKEVSSDE